MGIVCKPFTPYFTALHEQLAQVEMAIRGKKGSRDSFRIFIIFVLLLTFDCRTEY
jgi:hypothetical protein